MVIRNWRDDTPYVAHESAIIWTLLQAADAGGQRQAPRVLEGLVSVTRHLMQGRRQGDYHEHAEIEQIYYILSGQGTMLIDGERYPVREGDAIHLPPRCKHQLINDGEDWVDHLIISARVQR